MRAFGSYLLLGFLLYVGFGEPKLSPLLFVKCILAFSINGVFEKTSLEILTYMSVSRIENDHVIGVEKWDTEAFCFT